MREYRFKIVECISLTTRGDGEKKNSSLFIKEKKGKIKQANQKYHGP